MQKPRNQHWLPQFYMRYFAVPGYRKPKNAKIWTMDTQTGVVCKEKIQEIAAADHLYSHLKPDGTYCYRVEKQLGKLENIIARIYPRIAEGLPDLSEAWGIKKFMSVFIASLILRHPDAEEKTREMHRRIVDLINQAPRNASGLPEIHQVQIGAKAFPFDASDYDKYRASDENQLKQAFAEQIHPIAVEISDHLFAKRWCILCVDVPIFLSSDSPVIIQNTERQRFGIRTPGTHVWFPISPQRMLWMNDRKPGEVDGFYPMPLSQTTALNMFTLSHASRLLLAHQDVDIPFADLKAFIDEQYALYGPR